MARIEKTVFISYRRTDVYTALAVYQDLTAKGYDVFFDYTSIPSGDFEQIIVSNIKARAHFILILTPTALDRCNEPGDWLRREIEIAIDEKRNIVPLFFKGFKFGASSIADKFSGKLANLSRYNGLNVHEDYFHAAMDRLGTQFLSKPLDTVLHPVSTEVQKAVREEQYAVNKAIGEKEERDQQLARSAKENPRQILDNKRTSSSPKTGMSGSKSSRRAYIFIIVFLLACGGVLAALGIYGTNTFIQNFGKTETPTQTPTRAAPTPIDLKIASIDSMSLVYVPEGDFIMGSDEGEEDEKPVHVVNLDAFWIDQTEVTNAMYANCVNDGGCEMPSNTTYYSYSNYSNHPVVYVSWDDASDYCAWAGRRLPTEAEWEKAARGKNAFTYPWGNSKPNHNLSNYSDGVGDVTEVGKYPGGASPYGAQDMAGNVYEWVADWYDESYYGSSGYFNPIGPETGYYRVVRGGGFGSDYLAVRAVERNFVEPIENYRFLGFRCASE